MLTPLITTPYLARVLGADQVGVFAYTNSITQYFVMFALLGMSSYGVRLIASCKSDRRARSKAFSCAYAAQLVSGLPVMFFYIGYMFVNPAGGTIVAAMWGMYVLSAVIDVSWLLFGCEEFRVPTIRSIVTRLASLIIIFCFVNEPSDLWIYVMAIAGAFLANQVLIWPFVSRYIDFVAPTKGDVIDCFKGSAKLFIPVIAISLYTYLGKIILGLMAGMDQVGYFEYSQKLSLVPMSLITALGTVMLPRMTVELAAGHRVEAKKLLGLSVWAMLATAFGVAFGIAAIAPEFVAVFLGADFQGCAPLVVVMACVIPVISASNVLGRQWLLPNSRDKEYALSVCIGALVNIVLCFALIPEYAAMGACIAVVAAEISVLLAQVCYAKKELPLVDYAKNAIPYVIAGAIEFLLVRACAFWLGALISPVALLVLEVCCGAIVFVILSFLYCLIRKDDKICQLLGRQCPGAIQRILNRKKTG